MNQFELENQLCILSVSTIKKFLKYENGKDLIALYVFYYCTAKKQKTNQIKATPHFCMKGLRMGEQRFNNADRILRELGLVKKVPNRNKKGKILGWFVKISYLWSLKKEKILSPEPPKTTLVENQGSGKQDTNALSVINRNALNLSLNQKNSKNENMRERILNRIKKYFPDAHIPKNIPIEKIDFLLYKIKQGEIDPLKIRSLAAYLRGLQLEPFPAYAERERQREEIERVKKEKEKREAEERAEVNHEYNLQQLHCLRQKLSLGGNS